MEGKWLGKGGKPATVGSRTEALVESDGLNRQPVNEGYQFDLYFAFIPLCFENSVHLHDINTGNIVDSMRGHQRALLSMVGYS